RGARPRPALKGGSTRSAKSPLKRAQKAAGFRAPFTGLDAQRVDPPFRAGRAWRHVQHRILRSQSLAPYAALSVGATLLTHRLSYNTFMTPRPELLAPA